MSALFGKPAYAIYRCSPRYCQFTDAIIGTDYVAVKTGYPEDRLEMAHDDLNSIEMGWEAEERDPDVFFKVAPIGKPWEYTRPPASMEMEEIPF